MEESNFVLRALGKIASALGLNQMSEEVSVMSMSKEQMVKLLANDELVGLSEDILAGLDGTALRALLKLAKLAAKGMPEPEPQDNDQEPEPQDNEQQPCELPKEWQVVVDAVKELQSNVKVLQEERNGQEAAQKTALVEELSTNSACAFTKEQLEEMQVSHLKALKSSLMPVDYSGQGGGPRVNADEIEVLTMPDIFAPVQKEA